jgi:outer membrane protein assembly factor BamE (lipoprotein component of BamABCDE complex)
MIPDWVGGFMRTIVLALSAILLSACAIQRAQEAQDARVQMVGLSKEQVLACMGPPINKAAEGHTEVWTYNSGNGTTISGGSVAGGSFSATSSSRFCTVNVVMTKGQVATLNYTGPTGGLLTAGEQCAFAVDACVKPRG